MRKIVLVAVAALALSACSKEATDAAATVSEAAVDGAATVEDTAAQAKEVADEAMKKGA